MYHSTRNELGLSYWIQGYRRPLKKAGDGPLELRQLRAAVPHRP
jgi:hypothetical protein